MLRRLVTVLAATALALAGLSGVALADGGTTYVWVGAAQNPAADNHSWTDGRNWSPGGVPGDGDSVVISQPDGAHCTAAVDAVPTVSLVDFSMSQNPALCGTGISGGAISVSGSFTWDGGSLNTPVTLAAGSTGTISGNNGIRNSLGQNLTVAGRLDLADAAWVFFSNYGTVDITVTPGGTLGSTGNNRLSALSCCNSPGTVVNGGTMAIESGTLEADHVEVDQNSALQVAGGASLDSVGGLVNAPAGARYSGAGTWTIENGAKARLLGQQALGTGFHLQLGRLGADTGATVGGRFALAGTGTFDWSAGTIGGAITIGHRVHVHVSGATVTNGRRSVAATDPTSTSPKPSSITNHGTTVVDDGAFFTIAAAATLDNASDGTVQLAPGTVINGSACCVHPALFANDGGQVSVTPAATAAPVTLPGVAYRDTNGTTSVAAGQQLQLSHGPIHSLSGTHLVGGGMVQDAGVTAVSDDVALLDGTTFALVAGGTLDGTATIDGAGAVQWTGGSMSGDLTLAPANGTSVSGTAVKSVALTSGGTPSTVEVRTPLQLAAGTSTAHDVLELGSSSLVLAGNTAVSAFVEIHAGTLTNTGTMTVSAGPDSAYRTGPTATTANTGKISVASGTFAIANTFQQTKGTLEITATASANGLVTVAHAASVAGTVRIVNRYRPAVGTTLTVLTSAALTFTASVKSAGTGTATGHWAPQPSATALVVQWQANA